MGNEQNQKAVRGCASVIAGEGRGCAARIVSKLDGFDAADRATLRRLAGSNGVSVEEMADRVRRVAAGRRVSRRIDWRI